MGTVFKLWVAWVARIPNNCASGVEFNREPNFRHPAEERAVMKDITGATIVYCLIVPFQ